MSLRVVSFFGIFFLIGLGWLASKNRKAINWHTVFWGLGIQFVFALLVLKTDAGREVFDVASDGMRTLISFADRGAEFVFGPLYRGIPGNFDNPDASIIHVFNPKTGVHEPMGFVIFLNALMPIIFFASLMSVLYHLGVMKFIISFMAKGMHKLMQTSGSESLSASANIFVGQTEAPLVVKPFLESMTKSELHAIMAGGFATVAGGVLAVYVAFGIDPGHLLAASVMSAPAALVAAKLFYPETEQSVTAGEVKVELKSESVNVIDAACQGASDGMKLLLNVAAMLIAFLALIALVNHGIGAIDEWVRGPAFDPETGKQLREALSLEFIFGKLFYPIGIGIGIDSSEAGAFGSLLGKRLVANELLAYIDLMNNTSLSPRTYVLATYAFCGFANLGSIAIQIGGIGAIAESRKKDLARLGMRAMFAGTLASLFTATMVGVLLTDEEMAFQHYRHRAVQVTDHHYQKKIDYLAHFIDGYPEADESDRSLVQSEVNGLKKSALVEVSAIANELSTKRESLSSGKIELLQNRLRQMGTPAALKLLEDSKKKPEPAPAKRLEPEKKQAPNPPVEAPPTLP
jgi:CNT family concentrative nucleoside transporter